MTELYSKITIIVENEETKVVHTIPRARNIVLDQNAIEIREGILPREYLTTSLGFNFGLIADFDDAAGYVMRQEVTNKGRA